MPIKDDRPQPFSIKERVKSFRFAIDGLNSFFNSQHNAIIHLLLTVLVFVAAFFLKVNKTELIAIILATGLVWAAELFNTAIEKLCDLVSKDFHPAIKFIKDVSAAAVLLAAITALSVGLIIFLPKLLL